VAENEVAIATFEMETEALMWAELLKNEGIPSVLVPIGPGAGGWGANVWRTFELRVRPVDVERARELLGGQ
jgi:hypothetical protein